MRGRCMSYTCPWHGFAVSGTVIGSATGPDLPNLRRYHLGDLLAAQPATIAECANRYGPEQIMNSQSGTGCFIAENGVAVPAVTAEQMRELDRIATEETGPSLLQMMENAGRNMALLAMGLMASKRRTARVVVLAGSSGNGRGGGMLARAH